MGSPRVNVDNQSRTNRSSVRANQSIVPALGHPADGPDVLAGGGRDRASHPPRRSGWSAVGGATTAGLRPSASTEGKGKRKNAKSRDQAGGPTPKTVLSPRSAQWFGPVALTGATITWRGAACEKLTPMRYDGCPSKKVSRSSPEQIRVYDTITKHCRRARWPDRRFGVTRASSRGRGDAAPPRSTNVAAVLRGHYRPPRDARDVKRWPGAGGAAGTADTRTGQPRGAGKRRSGFVRQPVATSAAGQTRRTTRRGVDQCRTTLTADEPGEKTPGARIGARSTSSTVSFRRWGGRSGRLVAAIAARRTGRERRGLISVTCPHNPPPEPCSIFAALHGWGSWPRVGGQRLRAARRTETYRDLTPRDSQLPAMAATLSTRAIRVSVGVEWPTDYRPERFRDWDTAATREKRQIKRCRREGRASVHLRGHATDEAIAGTRLGSADRRPDPCRHPRRRACLRALGIVARLARPVQQDVRMDQPRGWPGRRRTRGRSARTSRRNLRVLRGLLARESPALTSAPPGPTGSGKSTTAPSASDSVAHRSRAYEGRLAPPHRPAAPKKRTPQKTAEPGVDFATPPV